MSEERQPAEVNEEQKHAGVSEELATPAPAEVPARLRAVYDLRVAHVRQYAGRHEYDGRVQDLSPGGVAAALGRLGGPPLRDGHDESHLRAMEDGLRVLLGELAWHRRNPLLHIENLDLTCYDRAYAPLEHRDAAREAHLAAWPDAVDAAVAALDDVPAPVARGLLPSAEGLGAGVDPERWPEASAAHRRFVAHVRRFALAGDPDPCLGGGALERLLAVPEAVQVTVGELAARADRERERLRTLLAEACGALAPGKPVRAVVAALLADHPPLAGVLREAQDLTDEVLAFIRERGLVPEHDGQCLVGPSPPSRAWAMAMMSWCAPGEPDAPSWFYVTPPDPAWPPQQQAEWLEVFSRTTLPAITVHEVAPGHFTHSRFLRRAPSLVRRTCFSPAFVEGWAHYGEELLLEEGFRAGDAHYAVGVAIEALVRVTRLSVALGLHSRGMSMEEAVHRFETDAFLHGPAARSEALRATFDPTYGRYTWGKLALLDLRERARTAWGPGYSHHRLHAALLDLGAPPIGLLDTAVRRG